MLHRHPGVAACAASAIPPLWVDWSPPIGLGAGRHRRMAQLAERRQRGPPPGQLALLRARARPNRQAALMAHQGVKEPIDRAEGVARLEDPRPPSAGLRLGIDSDIAARQAHIPYGHARQEGPPLGVGEAPPSEALAHRVECNCPQRAFASS